MKGEVVKYELLQIELMELNMPRPNFTGNLDELMWHYTEQVKYSEISNVKTKVSVILSYSLYFKSDPQKTSICFIKTCSSFSADRLISAGARLTLLYRFLNIAMWNLLGVYGAKTQNIFLSQMIPAPIHFKKNEEQLKAEINAHWK